MNQGRQRDAPDSSAAGLTLNMVNETSSRYVSRNENASVCGYLQCSRATQRISPRSTHAAWSLTEQPMNAVRESGVNAVCAEP